MDIYAKGCLRDKSSTQRTDLGLRAVKTDDNVESLAVAKTSPKCMTHGYTNEHHWDKWLARNRPQLKSCVDEQKSVLGSLLGCGDELRRRAHGVD